MTKLNWRDASKELPAKTSDTGYLVFVERAEYLSHTSKYITHAYFHSYGWTTDTDETVINWLPISEIQLPEE